MTMKETVFTTWPHESGHGHDKSLQVKIPFFVFLSFGCLLGGILADKYGRRKVISGFTCHLILMGFITSVAWSYESFRYSFFLMGMGIFSLYVPTYVRLVETLPRRRRLILSLVLFGSAWTMARISAVLVAYVTKDWRLLLFALSLAVCAIMMLSLIHI